MWQKRPERDERYMRRFSKKGRGVGEEEEEEEAAIQEAEGKEPPVCYSCLYIQEVSL
jgi:hypothetical protein